MNEDKNVIEEKEEDVKDINFSNLVKAEREVVLTIDEESDDWMVYASSPRWIKKIEKAGWKKIAETVDSEGRVTSREYRIPAKRIVIAKERKTKELSEEDREALTKRAEEMRKARK